MLDPRICLERHAQITAAKNLSNMVFMTCSHAQHVKTLETEKNGLGLSRPSKILRSLLIGLMNWWKLLKHHWCRDLSSKGLSQVSTASATSSSVLQSAATSASSKDLPSLSVSASAAAARKIAHPLSVGDRCLTHKFQP